MRGFFQHFTSVDYYELYNTVYDETNCLNILMNRPNMLLFMYNSNMSKHIIIIDNFSRHYLKEDITHSKCNIYQDINQDIISLDNYEYYYIYI